MWRQGSPTDVAATRTPRNPGRSPTGAGNPDPGIARVIIPPAIVITGPGPRLITDPVPAVIIGPDPIAITVRTPFHTDSRGLPAMSVSVHINPGPVSTERRVEIGLGIDLHSAADFQIGPGIIETTETGEADHSNYEVFSEKVHIHPLFVVLLNFAPDERKCYWGKPSRAVFRE